jgi:hypothetical protein
MSDPRLDDRNDAYGPLPPQGRWDWLPGAFFVLTLLLGVSLWAFLSGERALQARVDADVTTGQSLRPAVNMVPSVKPADR